MNILNEPIIFTQENIDKICELRKAQYVCDTTLKNGADCSVFYGETAHPVSNSRYFGLYRDPARDMFYICNGESVEDYEFDAVVADNGDIIYSRHRHDYRYSPDGSVWIDGGRSYTRSGLYDASRRVLLVVRDGKLQLKKS